MKIVDVSEFYAERGGGVRTYVHHKLRLATKAGVSVVVVAPGPEDREEDREGGRIVWVRSPLMPFDPRYYVLCRERAVHEILDRERPDVVEGSSTWSAGWFVARYRAPVVKTLVFHQDPVAVYAHTMFDRFLAAEQIDRLCEPYWSYLRRLTRGVDRVVVAGDWLAQRLTRRGVDNAVAVPFGIDPCELVSAAGDDELRRSWLARCGIADRDAALLFAVSRHHPEKRLMTVIEGFRQAAERCYPQRLGLVIFGDGPQRARVERLARRIPGVHVAGVERDRRRLAASLASGDALVHGSAAETYGLAVGEAIAAGLPVVVPTAGGAAELAHASYAETYRAGDASGCAAAILRMLQRDPTTVRTAARAAGSRQVATIEAHVARLLRLYGQLDEQRRRRHPSGLCHRLRALRALAVE